MKLYDAHCHLFTKINQSAVVNGTTPGDWAEIIELCQPQKAILPAIGLHPWKVNTAPQDWQAHFTQALEAGVGAIGEIGLDYWVEDHDPEQQTAAFCWQLEQATKRNLPVSIHCLKATDTLLRILKEHGCPKRGIHLHAYSGSAEQVSQFADVGAYFSFHAKQLSGTAKKAPAAVQAVPTDRLLIETDAPDTLESDESPTDFLQRGYDQVAELRNVSLENLVEQVATNFTRYFLDD